MRTSSTPLSFGISLALACGVLAAVACSSGNSHVGTTTQADTLDGGPCCASVGQALDKGTVPSCQVATDCCSGVCGTTNLCVCADVGGYCAANVDCCAGICDRSVPGGVCTSTAGKSCGGTPPVCSTLAVGNACNGVIGCSVQGTACVGTATPCSDLSDTQCTLQQGCSLQ